MPKTLSIPAIFPAVLLGFAVAVNAIFGGYPIFAADFRVDNQVFTAGAKVPDSRSTTIFYDGIVYDFLEKPNEVVVLDAKTGRFTLVDLGRRVQTQLTTDEVDAFVTRLVQWAAQRPDPMSKWFSDPQFDEAFNSAAARLTMTGDWMTYEARLAVAVKPAMAAQYREFSDCYARLNTLLTPGSRPPLPRLALNKALGERQAIAREVLLDRKDAGGKTTKVRSEHTLSIELTKADLSRVTQVRGLLRSLPSVSFDEYRKSAGP
jgi:hypothetical protein